MTYGAGLRRKPVRMDKTPWTDEQRQAIEGKNPRLLVAAAAGAGKTAVLVERIIRKITDTRHPVDIDRLLVVTFTNAAAAEMRERITEALAKRLEKAPGSHTIQRQLTLLSKASITTIHSFCLQVIRSNFQEAGIDPGFRIADDTESRLMKMEALDEVFEEQYENDDEGFKNLLENYGGNRDDSALGELVMEISTFVQSMPWPERYLKKMADNMNIPEGKDFGQTPWGKEILNHIRFELNGMLEILAHAEEIIKNDPELIKYEDVFREDRQKVSAVLDIFSKDGLCIWDRVYEAVRDFCFSRLPSASRDADKALKDVVQGIRNDVKKAIKVLGGKVIASDSAQTISDMRSLSPLIKEMGSLVNKFLKRYALKKRKKAVVDFNDLEHFCLDILCDMKDGQPVLTNTALKYREQFNEILVDEYQDSNMVQETIISMISGEGCKTPRVFMVGDIKQSIYRFRQARPEIFLEKYNDYKSRTEDIKRKVLLLKNFRSREGVINAVNFLFRRIMSSSVGELDYTDDEALHQGALYGSCPSGMSPADKAEFHIVNLEDTGEESDNEKEMLDRIQCEARVVAHRIRELFIPDKKGRRLCVYDKGRKEYRQAMYRDIVVLLRTTRNWAEVFAEEFALVGIPAFTDSGQGFFKTIEIQVVLSFLQVIDNPLQDIPLLSVLRSPVFSFASDELAQVRLEDTKAPLFNALRKTACKEQGRVSEKALVFMEKLTRWRDMAVYMSTDQLIWQLYNDTGYYTIVGAMPAGEQRQANLRMLFERARQFEQTSYRGLFNFINFIDRMKGSSGDMGSAKILGENENVVRIMSIHKSKGLEFPVVILSGCGKRFNLQDSEKRILLHYKLGFGPDVVDCSLRAAWPSAAKTAVRERIRAETLSEEMRILYVGMTRAREKLIVTGSVNNLSRAAGRWAARAGLKSDRVPGYLVRKGRSYIEWIGPALLKHRDSGLLPVIDDSSCWNVMLWNKNDLTVSAAGTREQEKSITSWMENIQNHKKDPGLAGFATERLGWEYPFSAVAGMPAKVSVSELKRRFNIERTGQASALSDMPVLAKKPKFLEGKKGLSAAEKGTALHFVMQHLDLNREDIETQIRKMKDRDLITAQQADSVDTERIRGFLNSSLGKRLKASGRVMREVPFNMEIPCSEVYGHLEGKGCKKETMLLQGIIDCYFEEPDGLVLLDYKTDYVPEGKTNIINERYGLQMKYYTRALSLLSGKTVKEGYIYLFRYGQAVRFNY